MPLFMDLHKASDYDSQPTVEDIKRNHIADLEVQHKYGVKFLQYWINEDAGLVFCLMEAPNKEACAAVHQEAHGGMPCNVIELKGGDYTAYMGTDTIANEFDIVVDSSGQLDPGSRILMMVDVISRSNHQPVINELHSLAKEFGGRMVHAHKHRNTMAFTYASPAFDCAFNLMRKHIDNCELRVAISAGEPVTQSPDIFADTITIASSLCEIAENGQVVISSLTRQLIDEVKLNNLRSVSNVRLLKKDDESFVNDLLTTLDLFLSERFSMDLLCKKMNLSRSKLYRRVSECTGMAVSSFINELRMRRAWQLLTNGEGNVTQIALEVGYNNPSYFAKNFQQRFGILPLKAVKDER